jgi:hypothetical protein
MAMYSFLENFGRRMSLLRSKEIGRIILKFVLNKYGMKM